MRGRLAIIVTSAIVAAAGCAGKAYLRPGVAQHPPRRVAVLPFVITYPYDLAEGQAIPESHTIGRDVFRKTFYYALTPYGYEDVELAEVDDTLARTWGPIEAGGWRAASPQALGQALGVDALVYGDLSRLVHVATPLYTETSLEASLRMVEASSGDILWSTRVQAAERGGALLKKGQVVDFVEDQIRSAHPRVKFLRVSDEAVRRALKELPNPSINVEDSAAARGRTAKDAGVMRLAVLPFGATHRHWGKATETLRAYMVASLQDSPFDVVEIQRVDAALKAQGWTEGAPLPDQPILSEVAKTLGADVWLRGTVTEWGRTYLVVQSWVKAKLQLDLLDASSGELIWSGTRKNTHQAGILKGPTGYTSLATAPITGLKSSHLDRVANHLTRSMVQDLSQSPAVLAYASEKRQR